MVIAKTIIEQILLLDPTALIRYQASNYRILEETKEREGGIEFNVRGSNFTGKVMIELDWLDEYRVTFINADGSIIKQLPGIHFPELITALHYIEED